MQIGRKQADKAIARALLISDSEATPSHYTSHLEAIVWLLVGEKRRETWDGQYDSAIAMLGARGFIRNSLV